MIEQFIQNLFTTGGFIQLLKWLVILLELVYLIFAFLLTREVKLMNSSFQTDAAKLFSFVAFIHLLATILLIMISLTFI